MKTIGTAASYADNSVLVPSFVLDSLSNTGEALSSEIHRYGNALHRAGLHRQATAADVAAGTVESIVEALKDGC